MNHLFMRETMSAVWREPPAGNKEKKKENLTDVEKLEQMPLPTGGAKKKYASMDANAMGAAAK